VGVVKVEKHSVVETELDSDTEPQALCTLLGVSLVPACLEVALEQVVGVLLAMQLAEAVAQTSHEAMRVPPLIVMAPVKLWESLPQRWQSRYAPGGCQCPGGVVECVLERRHVCVEKPAALCVPP
jgi:hypothetical protein